ncbi:MAG: CooT family nickel-binding protein [Chloroflexi bacterium]|jgi:predicted RNA-binding protein|nr:CooT family nickel-binding protein [Chloroflexota bacterium]MBT7080839.1 CooT family nickel-binding protein [Chloroflexota bacterium]MBT7288883.1 CooT family nickel-binding protein [Chloroflexota bacterium]
MCLAKVYLKDGDQEELVMETVTYAAKQNGKLLLRTILRQEKEIEAEITEIDFTNSRIVLKTV